MTRREVFLLPFAARLIASPAEFWNEKKPEDWTEEEVKELLTRSPWAKEASVSVFGGNGGGLINRNGATSWGGTMTGTGNGRQRSSGSGRGQQQTADAPELRYKAIVRWDSALPVRLALKSKAEPGDFYRVALVGDLALADPEETADQLESRTEMLKQVTKLDKKGGALPLVKVEPVKGVGTIFSFPREPFKDVVQFQTKLGPVEVKARFNAKEMMYRGKFEA